MEMEMDQASLREQLGEVETAIATARLDTNYLPALRLFRDELQRALIFLQDRQMAQRIAATDESSLYRSGAVGACTEPRATKPPAQPSMAIFGSRSVPRRPTHTCVICREPFLNEDLVRTPCRHYYCRTCISALFQNAMVDESLYPPRCCREIIPPEHVRHFISEDLYMAFNAKTEELDTVNRTYCANTDCALFISPKQIRGDVVACSSCQTQTCVRCKARAHRGDCVEDENLSLLLATAKEKQWQRCPKCGRMIELKFGCYHIDCLCGQQFCYRCGVTWKLCGCAQWDERCLLERAEEVWRRDAPADFELDATVVMQGLQTAARQLQTDHNCCHTTWHYLQGPRQCEHCGHTMPKYIYECRQCRLLVCRRCRFNRI